MRPIIFIGDSLTFGFGLYPKEGFVSKLSKSLKYETILNKSVNGDTSSGILSRYYKDVVSKNPKAVCILCGTNDFLSGRSADYVIDNLQLMIKDLILMDTKIIICIPPILLKDLAEKLFSYSSYYDHALNSLPELREKILCLKKIYPIEILDLYTLTKENISKGIFLDGIHLNSMGNTLIFNSMLPLFKGF